MDTPRSRARLRAMKMQLLLFAATLALAASEAGA